MLGLPAVIPPCYSSLAGVEVSSIRDRLSVLWHFSELVGQCWKMLDLHPNMVSASILLFLRKFQWFTLFIFSNFRPPKQSVLDTVWRRKGQDKKRAKNMIVGGLITSNNLPVRLFNIYVLSHFDLPQISSEKNMAASRIILGHNCKALQCPFKCWYVILCTRIIIFHNFELLLKSKQ